MRTAITAIVVAYNSDAEEMDENLSELARQVSVVVCDNTTHEGKRAAIQELCMARDMGYMHMKGNRGIAYAQNRGIEIADARGSEFVLLLDDDSLLSFGAVKNLLEGYARLVSEGRKVGAVSARAVDVHSEEEEPSGQPGQFYPWRDMMSSGSLLSMRCLRDVGSMDESLFIDYVDFDWAWRAIWKGYDIYRGDVYFVHALGEGVANKFGIKLKLKNPVRHYYQTRNSFLLMRKGYVPLTWKVKQLLTVPVKCLLFSILVPPRSLRWRNALRGFVDGICGNSSRLGPYSPREGVRE